MNGIELKENRLNHSLTQEKLAKLIGVSRNTIINYENGDVIPTTKSQILSTIFGNNKKVALKSKEDEYTTLIIDKLFQSDAFKERLKFYINENIISHEVTEQVLKYYAGLMKIVKEEDKKSNV